MRYLFFMTASNCFMAPFRGKRLSVLVPVRYKYLVQFVERREHFFHCSTKLRMHVLPENYPVFKCRIEVGFAIGSILLIAIESTSKSPTARSSESLHAWLRRDETVLIYVHYSLSLLAFQLLDFSSFYFNNIRQQKCRVQR